MSRPPQVPPIEEVARVAERLAVLLAAGVSPVTVWDYLLPAGPAADPAAAAAESARHRADPPTRTGHTEPRRLPTLPVTRRARARADTDRAQRSILSAASVAARGGDNVADAIAEATAGLPDQLADAWRALAAAWDVATRAGAPLAGCLRDLAAAFRELGQLHRDLTVALTGPRATARLVMVLPVVALLFGSLMGFDTLRTLFLTGPGLVCLALGCLLMVAAARWNRRLVAVAGRQGPAPGLELDLTAVGMAGGGSLDAARASARRSAERFGLRPAGAGSAGSADAVIERVLDLSARAGVPAGDLLRSEAAQARRDARTAGHQRAETLAVTLMIPLGVCVLPAFMLVGVAPLLLSVLGATLAVF
jgi:tight adherence protein B